MEYLDYNLLLIGIISGLLCWSLFRFISEWNKGKPKDSSEIDDFGSFLEIPMDQIIMAKEQGQEKDLRSLTRKIEAFKARNWFYRDKDFMWEKDLKDFVDM